MSTLAPLLEALQSLCGTIAACAVQQGPGYVVRVSRLQEVERAARRVVEAMPSAGLEPASGLTHDPDDSLRHAVQQAARLQAAANEGLCCCIDLRLAVSPSDFRALCEPCAQAVTNSHRAENRPVGRAPAGKRPRRRNREASKPVRDHPRSPQRVPKHVEMMGKARKLTGLIQAELQDDAGRSITEMCATVGISRETFGNSKHFEEPRQAWTRLQQLRETRRRKPARKAAPPA